MDLRSQEFLGKQLISRAQKSTWYRHGLMVSWAKDADSARLSQEWTQTRLPGPPPSHSLTLLPSCQTLHPDATSGLCQRQNWKKRKYECQLGQGVVCSKESRRGWEATGAEAPWSKATAREKAQECQVPGARAKHKALWPEMPRQSRKGEAIQATDSKVQGCNPLSGRGL